MIIYISGDWSYSITDGGTGDIVSYSGAGGNVTIPSNLGGYVISNINNSAFSDDSDITSIVIPSTISYIGDNAFSGTSITQVLNLSHVEITSTSYGLNGADISDSIPGELYISNVEYTLYDINADSPISIIIRLVPLVLLIGLIIWMVYRIKDRDDY